MSKVVMPRARRRGISKSSIEDRLVVDEVARGEPLREEEVARGEEEVDRGEDVRRRAGAFLATAFLVAPRLVGAARFAGAATTGGADSWIETLAPLGDSATMVVSVLAWRLLARGVDDLAGDGLLDGLLNRGDEDRRPLRARGVERRRDRERERAALSATLASARCLNAALYSRTVLIP